MSNITYISPNLSVRTYLQPGRITFILQGFATDKSVLSYCFKRFHPVLSIDAESSIHTVTLKNLDLDDMGSAPWLSLSLPSKEQATDVCNLICESLVNKQVINFASMCPTAQSDVKPPSISSTRRSRISLSSMALGVIMGVVVTWGVSQFFSQLSSRTDHALSMYSQTYTDKQKAYVQNQHKLISVDEPTRVVAQEPLTVQPVNSSSFQQSSDFPTLTNAALNNLRTAAQYAGLKLSEAATGTNDFWVFVSPGGGNEEALVLQRLSDALDKLNKGDLNAVVMPILPNTFAKAAEVTASLCLEGQSAFVTHMPRKWLSEDQNDPTESLENNKHKTCQGGINKLKLATSLFEFFGFVQTPVLVAPNGEVSAFANASSDEIVNWLEANK